MHTVPSFGTAEPTPTSTPAMVRRIAVSAIPTVAVACAAFAAAASAALDLDRDFYGLSPGIVAVTSATALSAGTVLLVGLRRWTRNGIRLFQRIIIGIGLLSLIGPLTVLGSEPPDGPAHGRPATALVLAALHVFCAAAAVRMANQLSDGSDV